MTTWHDFWVCPNFRRFFGHQTNGGKITTKCRLWEEVRAPIKVTGAVLGKETTVTFNPPLKKCCPISKAEHIKRCRITNWKRDHAQNRASTDPKNMVLQFNHPRMMCLLAYTWMCFRNPKKKQRFLFPWIHLFGGISKEFRFTIVYPLINVYITMTNHHFWSVNPL